MTFRNHYDVLGIQRNTSKDVIKSAYRKLSLKFHPDKNPNEPFFDAMFKLINEANEVLSNDNKRHSYDLTLDAFLQSKQSIPHDLVRREEELKRKQQELMRKEQDLRRQQMESRKKAVDTSQKRQRGWREVAFLFMVLSGVFFILAITNAKDEPTKMQSNEPLEVEEPIYQYVPSIEISEEAESGTRQKPTTMLPKKEENTDSIGVVTKPDIIEIQQPLVHEQAVTFTPELVDTVEEKPKWIQFKKRREWRKKNKNEN